MAYERDIQDLDFAENDLIARMAQAPNFKEWWSLNQERKILMAERNEMMSKSRLEKKGDKPLSDEELGQARGLIALYNKQHKTATQTILALKQKFGKLAYGSDAARVYWTETKRDDTKATFKLGSEIGFTEYKVVLSPSACPLCVKKTNNGNRIFTTADFEKKEYGHVPPFHPYCYCIVIPFVS